MVAHAYNPSTTKLRQSDFHESQVSLGNTTQCDTISKARQKAQAA